MDVFAAESLISLIPIQDAIRVVDLSKEGDKAGWPELMNWLICWVKEVV